MLNWEKLESSISTVDRAKVPGGWFIKMHGESAFFYPDPEHIWDGSSLP